ncbi:prepilin peptidase [Sphingomonas cavernae]|uniref:Prepilin leader peptidase/N-methyltransferase n=1 Tax=Sphingomonas cavernae TaxID=2320861 RepID=A0A418W5P9_9SPHN|nr:A24 family peptidase [Sphingomonas cavernae]RJF85356.1 prepilin peptidase [Sphingomonas cavernae]
MNEALLPLAGAVAGAIFGSFIANLVIRWPRGEQVMVGRSRCEACGKPLVAAELVPIVSHLIQRGRCRGCGAAIDRKHLAIEIGAALIGASALFASPDLNGVAGAIFGWFLLALAALDAEHFWLPDRLTLPLGVLGLAVGATGLGVPLIDRVIGAAAGFGALAAIALAYRALRGREGLGWGDPKLLGAIGAWLGWQMLPLVLLFASILGLLAVLAQRARGEAVSATTRVPLGALMAVAAWPLWLLLASGIAGFVLL